MINWTIGQVMILVNFIVVLCWIPLKQKPGIGTVLGIVVVVVVVVVVGLLVDLTFDWLPKDLVLWQQWLCLLGGIGIFGFGTGAFVCAHLGGGPKDGVMVGIAKRGYSVQKTRIFIDATVLLVGWMMGGTVGLGTVIIAFGLGPIVQQSMKVFTPLTRDVESLDQIG
jgi:uncharacterized membrane protein YczE